MQDESSRNTGPTCGDTTMSEPSRQQQEIGASMSSVEARPASEQALRQPFKVNALAKLSGPICVASCNCFARTGSLSNNQAATNPGKRRLRVIWRELAITHPDYSSRLECLVRLISAGECSLLPTPCKSDATRWHGSPDHPRLQASRGLRLQEELGVRPGPEIVEWMMGFPPGWTDLEPSVTPSSRK